MDRNDGRGSPMGDDHEQSSGPPMDGRGDLGEIRPSGPGSNNSNSNNNNNNNGSREVMGSAHMRPVFLGNLSHEVHASDIADIFERPLINLDGARIPVDRIDLKRGFCFVFLKPATSQADKDRAERYLSEINGIDVPKVSKALRAEFARGDGRIKRKEDDRRKNIKPSETLFVVNFHEETTKREDLQMLFEPFGELVRIDMKKNYAFVQYTTVEDATRAREATDGGKLDQSVITVEFVANRMGYERRRGDRGGDRDRDRGGYRDRPGYGRGGSDYRGGYRGGDRYDRHDNRGRDDRYNDDFRGRARAEDRYNDDRGAIPRRDRSSPPRDFYSRRARSRSRSRSPPVYRHKSRSPSPRKDDYRGGGRYDDYRGGGRARSNERDYRDTGRARSSEREYRGDARGYK